MLFISENKQFFSRSHHAYSYRCLKPKNIEKYKTELRKFDCNLINNLNCEDAYSVFNSFLQQS